MRLAKLDLLPDSDALLVTPVRPSALKAVVQVRRLVMVIKEYSRQLEELPDSQPTLLSDQSMGSVNLGKGNLPGALQVVNITAGMSSLLLSGLRKLVVNSTWGEEPDPMARDGKPNRLLQKLLRELNTVDISCTLLQVPFKKGVDIDQVSTHPEYATLKAILNLVYRLLKQMCKEDSVNSKSVFRHVGAMRRQLGKGILVTLPSRRFSPTSATFFKRSTKTSSTTSSDYSSKTRSPSISTFSCLCARSAALH